MYKNLTKELDKWTKSQGKTIKGKGKVDSKKDMRNFALIFEILMQMWFLEVVTKQPQSKTSKVQKQLAAKP
jgi:hypothetical protein